MALITTLLFASVSRATPGINQTLSFNGRLQTASGAVVPDGYYNIQFKLYQDGDGLSANDATPNGAAGALKWTESYVNNGGTSGVQVTNGFFSVNLGSKNPFGNQVDWNQDTLWLSMNIGGSASGCTSFGGSGCAGDGEMLPMKRITATPFSLNSAALGGKTAAQFLQLAQGVQTDASTNTSSIFINKTGTGNLVQLQNNGVDIFNVSNGGDLTLGNNANHSLSVATSTASNAGGSLVVSAGNGGTGTGTTGGNLTLQGGSAGGTNGIGGSVTIDAGASSGTGTPGFINIGTMNAGAIQIGSSNMTSGTQTITIGGQNVTGGAQNVKIGADNGASAGTTTIQSKNETTIRTDGATRATFDTNNRLFLGNGSTSVSPVAFSIQGTSSTTAGVTGGNLTVQGGNSTVGNANGGNLTLSGGSGAGTGASGLVVLTTPTFQSSGSVQTCSTAATSLSISQTSVDSNSVIPVASTSSASCVVSLPNPTITTAGRIVYITADGTSTSNFTLSVNGGGTGNTVMMRAYTTATMVWNGSAWTIAGASSSTTLQAAYDNTIQNSGGAELIVGKTNNTNGLTIRDSTGANAVNGSLFNVQSGSASNLFSINSNVTEYASDPGAENALDSAHLNQFPSNTWAGLGTGASVTRNTATNNNTIATGQASVGVTTTGTANSGAINQIVDPAQSTPTPVALSANNHYNVSFSVRLPAGASTFNDLKVDYSADGGTTNVTSCTTAQTAAINVWTKVNCSFTAPASGITTANAILIRQLGTGSRTFYIDNLSVTIAADFSLATDGGVNDAANFGTNWTTVDGNTAISQTNSDSNTASYSAQATIASGGTNTGIKNKLSIKPNKNTRYRVSVYAKSSNAFSDFTIRYTRDGGTNFVNCQDYNTQVLSTSTWTKITCYINTDGTDATTPQVAFVEAASAARTFLIDDFSMTLATASTPNVQIGSGTNGGPTTLLTLDRAASAPIAGDNDQLLGSMYYDTSLGKLQCYEARGWGSCGSAPDNIITITPEYANAVMHGTGVGTMTSDICSNSLGINDGSSGQATICGTNETRNFYKWTSPQASAQTYSVYVTYQLPSTFKAFTSSSTSLQAKTDSNNASVAYQIYKSNSSGLSACGGNISVATGNVAWQTGIATAGNDPYTCNFSAGDSIVFKITLSSLSNANAYISNLGFTFSNK